MALGKKIRALREEMGMSQAELASCAELSQGYLSQLENDEVQNPSAAVILRLSKAVHVDPQLLMRAAGYPEAEGSADNGFDMSVDPDLLRFVSRLGAEHQINLLRLLEAMEPSENGQPSPRTPNEAKHPALARSRSA